jgi:hypothetical protein
MLKFKNVHIYCNQAGTLDFNVIVPELQKYFPNIPIDVRHPFLNNLDNVLAESLILIHRIRFCFQAILLIFNESLNICIN